MVVVVFSLAPTGARCYTLTPPAAGLVLSEIFRGGTGERIWERKRATGISKQQHIGLWLLEDYLIFLL